MMTIIIIIIIIIIITLIAIIIAKLSLECAAAKIYLRRMSVIWSSPLEIGTE